MPIVGGAFYLQLIWNCYGTLRKTVILLMHFQYFVIYNTLYIDFFVLTLFSFPNLIIIDGVEADENRRRSP
jgi:hypothetical protein